MAISCAGVTATWNGVSFGEVTEIKVTCGGSLPLGRDSLFSVDAGSIDITCLSAANMSAANHGKKATLAISGGVIDFSAKATLQTFQLAGKVNDIARYSATFKLVKE